MAAKSVELKLKVWPSITPYVFDLKSAFVVSEAKLQKMFQVPKI